MSPRRFDRAAGTRIPFLSALSMLGLKDGERGSYPEFVDALAAQGAHTKADAQELYRRVLFNVLVSNVDDHLRNHGCLWAGPDGWTLSPMYDVNPTPADVRPRILTTNINLDEGTCDLDLVLSVAEFFGLTLKAARALAKEVASATSRWREVAARAGAPGAEINRMASAFQHTDLDRALAL